MTQFTPSAYDTFAYTSYDISDDFTEIQLHYALKGEEADDVIFTEKINFPGLSPKLSPKTSAAATKIVQLLFLAAGLSYYKTAAPGEVRVDVPISAAEKQFLETLISEGMTEFAYVNKLLRSLHPRIAVQSPAQPEVVGLSEQDDQPVVPVGGGKDSIVTIEALRAAGFQPHLFSVKTYAYGAIVQTAERAALPYGFATRELSPVMREINQQGALSGHVPITAVVSLVSLLFAVLTGHKTVVISSERSASSGNVLWEGVEVNHQWAKSLALESLLRDTLRAVVSPDLNYFSLLRPLSELQIAKYFATLTRYHDVFSSCNRAFLAEESQEGPYWCGHCPKCRFVFLILAPFLKKAALVDIFGADLLDEDSSSQLAGFRELLGIEGHKPLECVGEIEEARWAFGQIAANPQWQSDVLVKKLAVDLPAEAMPTPEQEKELFTPSAEHFVPKEYQEALDEIS